MSSVASQFRRPLLIYDDKCYSCTKFAELASTFSRGWIRIAGHYNSDEAAMAKSVIFPAGYDSTKMFWLVNSSGAYGARSGLPRVLKEIAFGLFAAPGNQSRQDHEPACEYTVEGMSCFTSTNVIRRLVKLLSHGKTFSFRPEK